MKFGLYVHPSINLSIRCIDGHFDLLPDRPASASSTPARMWEYYSTAAGRPCRQDIVLAKLQSAGSLLTYCRSIAKVLYGVPDDVDLYVPGDMGINTELAGKLTCQ